MQRITSNAGCEELEQVLDGNRVTETGLRQAVVCVLLLALCLALPVAMATGSGFLAGMAFGWGVLVAAKWVWDDARGYKSNAQDSANTNFAPHIEL